MVESPKNNSINKTKKKKKCVKNHITLSILWKHRKMDK
jgi:hypothetical protein